MPGDRALFAERTGIDKSGDALPDRQPPLCVLVRDRLAPAVFTRPLSPLLNAFHFFLPAHSLCSFGFLVVGQALSLFLETVFIASVASGLRMVAFSSPSSLSTACRLPPGTR